MTKACHGPTLVDRPGVGLGRAGQPGPSHFRLVGHGPARPVKLSEDRPRPGPVHQIFRGWAATRRSPSHFQKLTARLGPAHHFFRTSLGPARPGLVHHMAARPMRHGLYMGRPDNYVHGLAHGPAHVLSRTKRCMCIR